MEKGKKILKLLFTFVLMVLFMGTINAESITLEDIAEKFNENGFIDRLTNVLGDVSVSAEVGFEEGEKVLYITSETEETSSTITYSLDGSILSGYIFEDDVIAAMNLIDSVAQLNGYEEGDLYYTLTSNYFTEYTLENEGVEIKEVEESSLDIYEINIDIDKQIPIINILMVKAYSDDSNPDEIIKGEVAIAPKNETIEFEGNINATGYSKESDEYTVSAKPYDGYVFYKWLKDGNTYSYDEELTIDLDEDYRLTALFLESNKYLLTVNALYGGQINIADSKDELEFDDESPFTSAYRNNNEVETITVGAKANDGYRFVKWTLNGENYSTEPILNIKVDKNIDLVAVFKSLDDEVGEIEKREVTNNYGNASISNSSSEIKELLPLTMDELDALEDGSNIYAFIEVSDISNTISDNDKKLIESKLDANSKVGIYLDINLFKQIENQDKVKVEKTNGKVKISFEIPESLRNDNRTFYIVKLHDGVATIINPTRNNNILTFETDEFSTYALTYTDKSEESNPNTGDNIMICISLLIISIIGLTAIGLNTKKVNNN